MVFLEKFPEFPFKDYIKQIGPIDTAAFSETGGENRAFLLHDEMFVRHNMIGSFTAPIEIITNGVEIYPSDLVREAIKARISFLQTYRRYFQVLSETERHVISLRHSFSGESTMTYQKIGERIGKSRWTVSRMIKSAISKLRELKNETLDENRKIIGELD